jgi:hypothetical protein
MNTLIRFALRCIDEQLAHEPELLKRAGFWRQRQSIIEDFCREQVASYRRRQEPLAPPWRRREVK